MKTDIKRGVVTYVLLLTGRTSTARPLLQLAPDQLEFPLFASFLPLSERAALSVYLVYPWSSMKQNYWSYRKLSKSIKTW